MGGWAEENRAQHSRWRPKMGPRGGGDATAGRRALQRLHVDCVRHAATGRDYDGIFRRGTRFMSGPIGWIRRRPSQAGSATSFLYSVHGRRGPEVDSELGLAIRRGVADSYEWQCVGLI